MINPIRHLYRTLFARERFFRWNRFLFNLSLHGFGLYNYENFSVSGEKWFLNYYLAGRKAPVVFDVGANLGEYSRLVLEANSSSKIHAFEPHPLNYDRLIKRRISRVHIHQLALSDAAGTITLYDRSDQDGSSHASLAEAVFTDIHRVVPIQHCVQVDTLDDFLSRVPVPRIDLLKIDVEGYELQVLRGARAALRSGLIDAIQFEFNEMNVATRSFLFDFITLLEGYRVYRLLPKGLLETKQYRPVLWELFGYQNIIALRG